MKKLIILPILLLMNSYIYSMEQSYCRVVPEEMPIHMAASVVYVPEVHEGRKLSDLERIERAVQQALAFVRTYSNSPQVKQAIKNALEKLYGADVLKNHLTVGLIQAERSNSLNPFAVSLQEVIECGGILGCEAFGALKSLYKGGKSTFMLDNNLLGNILSLEAPEGRMAILCMLMQFICKHGDLSNMRYCLEKLNHIDDLDDRKILCTHILRDVVKQGKEDMVRLLLSYNPLVNFVHIKQHKGRSALFIAVENESVPLARLLIEAKGAFLPFAKCA